MNGFCPSCLKETNLSHVQREENLIIKGETISVPMDYFVCPQCGEEFDNPDPSYDPLATAYREYRRRKGMIQPEEILAFRINKGLTQRELSNLLGFGGATLSRYENGALQDETHDTILRFIMDDQNLLKIVQQKSQAIDVEKREQLIDQLQTNITRAGLLVFLEKYPQYRSASLYNGFREINIDRLLTVIKLLCYKTIVY